MKYPAISEEKRCMRLSIPHKRIPLIIDTDAKNEIDDQFAIAWALRSPERFDVKGVYAAPFSHDCFGSLMSGREIEHTPGIQYTENPAEGMNQSYEEIIKLFGLLEIPLNGRVLLGSESYLSDTGKAVKSPAAEHLVHLAMESEEPLYIAAIGAATNIASAILMEPEIINKIVVVWLGGQPLWFSHGIEFNLMQDIESARVLFDSGVPLVYIPCMNVASLLSVTEDEVKAKLSGKNSICDYLAQNVLEAFKDSNAASPMLGFYRSSYLKDREDQPEEYLQNFSGGEVSWSRIIWDISTIAFLKNPGWCPSTLEPSPQIRNDLTWMPVDSNRHKIRVVNYCHRDMIFGDMFHSLS